jgi:transcriptional regulator with XRE-family HTH domain
MPPPRTTTDQANGEKFAAQLQRIMNERAWSQADLSRQIGVTQQAVSDWMAGKVPRDPSRVFEIERKLGVSPGFISHVLGYQPVGATHVPAAIAADTHLPDDWKWTLTSLYRQAVELAEKAEPASAAATNGKAKR